MVKIRDYAYWKHSDSSRLDRWVKISWWKSIIAGAISFVMTLLAVALNTFKERLSGFIHVAYTPPKFGFHLGYFLPLLLVATLTGIFSYWKYLWFLESNQIQRKKHRVKGFVLFFPIFLFFPIIFFWLVIFISFIIDLYLRITK